MISPNATGLEVLPANTRTATGIPVWLATMPNSVCSRLFFPSPGMPERAQRAAAAFQPRRAATNLTILTIQLLQQFKVVGGQTGDLLQGRIDQG